jgi:hypothetical protein
MTPNSNSPYEKRNKYKYKINLHHRPSDILFFCITNNKHSQFKNISITNTSKIPSDVPSFNISDITLIPSDIIFLPSSLNFPCGLGIINLDNGRKQSENNNNNK